VAQRVLVFFLTVLIALVTGLWARRTEMEASARGQLWPGRRELQAQDVLLRSRKAPAARSDVVIVAADDASVKKYGKLPWSRATWASGVARAQGGGARMVVFDFDLHERTTRAADRALFERMANGRRAVLGMGYNANRPQKWTPGDVRALRFLEKHALVDNITLRGAAATLPFAWPLFEPPVSDFTQAARGVGVFLRETDQDGLVRHARLLYLSQVKTPPTTIPLPPPPTIPASRLNGLTVALPSLALTAARQSLNVDKTSVQSRNDTVVISGDFDEPFVIPVDSASRMIINYAGPSGAHATYSFADVASGKVPASTFRGKNVLFGATAAGAEGTDLRVTPAGPLPRVEITANALGSILGRRYLVRSRGNDVVGILIALGVVAGLLLTHRRVWPVLLTGLLLTLAYLAAAWGLLAFRETLLPLLPALLVLGVATLLAAALAALMNRPRMDYPDPSGGGV
jgi:serine/threonine-protein kinase